MREIYQLFGDYGKEDLLNVFSTYFKNGTWAGNGYTEAFLIAIVVSLLALVVFYVGIGNTSFRLSNVYTWVVVGVLAGLLTFGVTSVNTGMTPNCGYGLQETLNQQWRNKSRGLDSESIQYKNLEKCKRDYQKRFKKGVMAVDTVFSLCLVNTIITFLLYFGLSFIRPFRRMLKNKYAQSIPTK